MVLKSQDRRDMIKGLALAGLGTVSLSNLAYGHGHHNVDTKLRRRYCQTQFGQVHYWVTGSGPFLTMIHQSAQSSDEFAQVAPFLADSFRVVAIDLPGHGRSDDPEQELGLRDFTNATMAVLDDLGVQRTHILGHHGGLGVAIDLANRQPERIDKIIMSGGGTPIPEQTEALQNTPMTRELPMDAEGDFLDKTWTVYRRMSAKKTPPEITILPFIVSLQARLRPFDMHYALYRWDGAVARKSFNKETLLINPKEDMYGGDVAERHRQMENSSYAEIEDAGVWVFY